MEKKCPTLSVMNGEQSLSTPARCCSNIMCCPSPLLHILVENKVFQLDGAPTKLAAISLLSSWRSTWQHTGLGCCIWRIRISRLWHLGHNAGNGQCHSSH
jgi:hypothetical protein